VTQITFAVFLVVIAIVDAPGLHDTVTRLRAWREGGTREPRD
jgi:hypothetical protein